jgi:hypothetical protein
MLEKVARVAPLQPNEAMARINPRSTMVPMVNDKYQCGDMHEAMARIAPSQPNEAMARIIPRSPMVPMVHKKYEHSEQARAPYTNGPMDVPRCGAISLLKPLKKLELI